MKFKIPESNAPISNAITSMQDAYETDGITCMIAVYTSGNKIQTVVVGDSSLMPTVALAVDSVAESVINQFKCTFYEAMEPDFDEDDE